jgi:uncharacterized membrane protein HdeD (DUF308 family)
VNLPLTIPDGLPGKCIGVLAIVAGILALVFPVLTFSVLEFFFAVIAVLIGIDLVRSEMATSGKRSLSQMLRIAAGLLGIGIGLSIFVIPRFLTIAAKELIGIWALITGIGYIVIVFRTEPGFDRVISAVTGIVIGIVGLLLLFVPVIVTDFLLVILLGFIAIGTGLYILVLGSSPPAEKRERDHFIYK